MRSTFSISIDPKLDTWITKNHSKFGFKTKSSFIELAITELKAKKDKLRTKHKHAGVK